MPADLQPASPPPEFTEILQTLRTLTRDFLLGFRLQVGQLMLDRFFGGDVANYRDQDPNKSASFLAFSHACAEDLHNLGLQPQVLRHCINARATYDTLPPAVRETLLFTQVVELARVADSSQRARLAMDATAQNWSVAALKEAVRKANDGKYFDTDPATPGTQPPADGPAAAAKPKPGVVLNQFERALKDLGQMRQDWLAAGGKELSAANKERAAAVLAGLKAELAELEKVLAAGG